MENKKYNLYFVLNGHKEFQGTFQNEQKAWDFMEHLIETKSRLKDRTKLRRWWAKGNRTFIDYGAHNAHYFIEELES